MSAFKNIFNKVKKRKHYVYSDATVNIKWE